MATYIYYLDLNSIDSYTYRKLLERYNLYNQAEFSQRIINHLLLRYGLINDFEQINCQEIKIGKDIHGAPYLRNFDLNISLSHSRTVTGCAISNYKIGLDVQNYIIYKSIYESFILSDNERERKYMCFNKNQYITVMWSLKEAYGKMNKYGLNYPFSKTDFEYMLNNDNVYNSIFYRTECNDNEEYAVSCCAVERPIMKRVVISDLMCF